VKQSLLLDNIMRIMTGVTRARASSGSAAPDIATSAVGSAAGVPLRVLLAEDNPVNVKFAVKLLEKAGHITTQVGNGKLAVDLWSSAEFDVILMDIQMPEMDGLDATRAIRAAEKDRNGGTQHIPIIAMTANAMAGDREMCIDAGMDGYVAKPVKRDALFAELDRLVAPSKST
jgi:two-component system sensor histidine kinase/response regulator